MSATGAQRVDVSVAQLATFVGVTEQWIRRLIREGWIPAPEQHRVSLVAGVQGYLRYLKDPNRRIHDTAAAVRLNDAKARLLERRVAEKDERLIDVREHKEVFEHSFGIVSGLLAGVPARATDDPEMRRKLEAEIAVVLDRARKRFVEGTEELTGRPFDD